MQHRKTIGVAFSQGVIGAASSLWWTHREKARQRDLTQAISQDRARANQGDRNAQYRLGSAYYDGVGVPQNNAEAVRWFRMSAEQGNAAQYALGYEYLNGRGVPRDLAEAARWYRKAAEQGDPAGQLYLGQAYRNGQGVPQSYVEAARWYLRIARYVALRSARRLGWTPFLVLVVCVSFLVVPAGRWGRARWLPWALLAVACGALAYHLVFGSIWSGWGHVLDIVVSVILSALSAWAAVHHAIRQWKQGAARGQRTTPPEAPSGNLTSKRESGGS